MSDLMLDCFSRPVFPLDLHPSDVRIEEIAHSLSKICRFNGRYRGAPYSVTEHCLNVAILLEHETNNPLVKLVGLLHDAHETFLGDISAPWYPFLLVRQDNVQMPLRKFAEVLQAQVILALIPSCAVTTYHDARERTMLIVADADHQILLYEKALILGSKLPWPGQDNSPPVDGGRKGGSPSTLVEYRHPLIAIREFMDTYARLFSAVESAFGSPSVHGGTKGGLPIPIPTPSAAPNMTEPFLIPQEPDILLVCDEFESRQFGLGSWKVFLVDGSIGDMDEIDDPDNAQCIIEIGTLLDIVQELRAYRATNMGRPAHV